VADDCVALGGVINAGECQISSAQSKSNGNCAGGTSCQLDETLHLLPGGSLTVSPVSSGLTLNITGSLLMDDGSRISGNVSGSATGATIIVNATGDIILHGNVPGTSGAVIASDSSCTGGVGKAGKIVLTADSDNNLLGDVHIAKGARVTANADKCSAGQIDISGKDITNDGLVESASNLTGTGTNQQPGGGPINLNATCNLVTTGKVSSRGKDPGADRVHLEGGCHVQIFGLVESTGPGHAIPTAPANHCDNNAGKGGGDRPDKPSNSTACVEIWAGDSLEIDSVPPHTGEVNADTAQSGGNAGLGWIDIFVRGTLVVSGDTGSPYAVHANQFVTNGQGGLITLKSTGSTVTMTGLAVQANSSASGGKGGTVTIEANNDVALNTSSTEARGANTGGAANPPAGGKIAVQSFNGQITGTAPGELDAFGGNPANGTVKLTACTAVAYTGTVVGTLMTSTGVCGGAPSLQSYVSLKDCLCVVTPDISVTKECSCVDPGRDGLPPFTINFSGKVCNPGPVALTNVNVVDDQPNPNTPVIGPISLNPTDCTTFNGTFNSSLATSTDKVTATGTGGQTQVMATASATCACAPPPPPSFCQKDSIRNILDPNGSRFPGNAGPDVIVDVRLAGPAGSVQTAIDNAIDSNLDGYIIIGVIANNGGLWGGSTTQSIVISQQYTLPFALLACSVTLNDPTPGDKFPTAWITDTAGSPTNIFVMDLHAANSTGAAGWLIEGDGRELRNTNTTNNKVGVDLKGNSNIFRSGNQVKNRGFGILVEGDGNLVSDTNCNQNASDGIRVTGDGNTLRKNDVAEPKKGNSGDGINVLGDSNFLQENRANSNTKNGIEVSGVDNQLQKNVANTNTGKEFLIGPNNQDLGGNEFNNGLACTGFGGVGGTCN
jgi:hypothetical protein